MVDPNKIFKKKDEKTGWCKHPNVSVIYGNDKRLNMTCTNCQIVLSLHISAHSAFKPSSVTCECGSNDWLWTL